MNIFGEHQKDFIRQLNKENAKRLQVIAVIVLALVSAQAVVYSLSVNELYNKDLIRTKLLIIVAGTITVIALQMLKKDVKIAVKHSSTIIFCCSFFMIFFATLNTFQAQGISNDISIYLLVLMAVIAADRMESKATLIILALNYIIFAVGMEFYQSNSIYLFSHRFNGALCTVLAFIISRMFFRYSIMDFKDKLDIDQKSRRLRDLSERDDLTGLYNRRTIYSRLEELIQKAKETNKSVYLGILDLDHFKDINDLYGHLYGDDALRIISNKILSNVRAEDIVGRYGGDEFVIVFHDIDYESVYAIMARLLQEVNKLDFDKCKLSFSCGVAVWNGESSEKLFERADAFMYDVKRYGKNDVKIEQLKVVTQ